jgi:hypothetical protein
MKKLVLLMISVSALVSGCVVYDVPQHDRGEHRGNQERDRDRDGVPDRADRDRDGDGIRNNQDRRPDDGRRY